MTNTFSQQSQQYALYRPVYPGELFDFLDSLVEVKENSWDCGTGNGQVAFQLKNYFQNVYATDISYEQIANAVIDPKIKYSVQPAEQTIFPDRFFDLITVAQAVHWFDFDKFYAEVRRTLKPNGLFVVIGYSMLSVSPAVDAVIRDFYSFTGPFWDPQRKYLDDHYKTIPFPFDEIKAPEFTFHVEWSLDHLVGYLKTWSAVKHFVKAECYNPVDELFPHLKDSWGDEVSRRVEFPLFMRVGRLYVAEPTS